MREHRNRILETVNYKNVNQIITMWRKLLQNKLFSCVECGFQDSPVAGQKKDKITYKIKVDLKNHSLTVCYSDYIN